MVALVQVRDHCHEASCKCGCQVDSDWVHWVFYLCVDFLLPVFKSDVILLGDAIPIGPADGEDYNEAEGLVPYLCPHELLRSFECILWEVNTLITIIVNVTRILLLPLLISNDGGVVITCVCPKGIFQSLRRCNLILMHICLSVLPVLIRCVWGNSIVVIRDSHPSESWKLMDDTELFCSCNACLGPKVNYNSDSQQYFGTFYQADYQIFHVN